MSNRIARLLPAWGGGAETPFDPLTLSPSVWFDFSDITTLFQDTGLSTAVTADGQTIKGILDKSGNSRNATDATGCTYKTGIQNGLSVGRGNGSSSKLVTGSVNWGVAADAPFWIAAVFVRRDSAAAYKTLAAFGSYVPAFYYSVSTTNKNTIFRSAAGTFDAIFAQNTCYILDEGRIDATKYNAYINGVKDAQEPNPFDGYAIAATTLALFAEAAAGGSYGQIDLCEFFFWNSKPSDENLAFLRTYLDEKWNP